MHRPGRRSSEPKTLKTDSKEVFARGSLSMARERWEDVRLRYGTNWIGRGVAAGGMWGLRLMSGLAWGGSGCGLEEKEPARRETITPGHLCRLE